MILRNDIFAYRSEYVHPFVTKAHAAMTLLGTSPQ
jgi:hypothetical protein